MNKIIYTTKFYCEFCKKNIPLQVYGDIDSTFPESEQEKKEAKEWGEHYHWIDHHRRCAMCGELVVSGSQQDEPDGLNLVVNEGRIKIHPKYATETMGRSGGRELLTVHNKCVEKENENSARS